MKKLLLLSFIFISTILQAQIINIGEVTMLKGTARGGYFHAVFAPDGTFIVTSQENYNGLMRHDIETGKRQKLSSAQSAGYGAVFSEDSKSIYYNNAETKDAIRYNSLERVNTKNSEKVKLSAAARYRISPARYIKSLYITIEDEGMLLHKNGTTTLLAPIGEESYYWTSISPDQQHILFSTAYHGTCVCEINGDNVVRLGRLNAPKWMGNDCVIGMQEKDDEQGRITSSKLVVMTIDGKKSQTLNLKENIAMYPAASIDGKRIAFNNAKGQIYLIEVK